MFITILLSSFIRFPRQIKFQYFPILSIRLYSYSITFTVGTLEYFIYYETRLLYYSYLVNIVGKIKLRSCIFFYTLTRPKIIMFYTLHE